KDGAIFLWTDRGRPQVALKIFTFDNKSYAHAWLSLSEGTLTAERGGRGIWNPSEPGGAFREVPDAPGPADTAAAPLRRAGAAAGRGEGGGGVGGELAWTYTAAQLDAKPFELRLLTQPVYRYETEDARADGAVFVFVQSTASVALLLLESRRTRDGHRWHYAFASMVFGPVTVRDNDKEIATIEKEYSRRDRTKPYLEP